MNFPSLGVENSLHVGLSDPTFVPKNILKLPGLATINGPLIVGGTLVDGIMGPANPKTSVVNIIPSLNAVGTALKISALGDGISPFPGIGLQVSAISHNILATGVISITSPLTTIKGSLVDVLAPTYIKTLLNVNGVAFVEKFATFKDAIFTGSIIANGAITANARITANTGITITGLGDVTTEVNLAKALPAKPFDIPHPSKPNHRLRHVAIEGPEIAVFYRGKLDGEHIIQLPDYWKDLVDEKSITVQLTPWKYSDPTLYVKDITAERIVVGSDKLLKVHCHYTVFAERKDLDKLIVEYEGATVKDYPGQDFIGVKNGN
jgi:hypothetical protein